MWSIFGKERLAEYWRLRIAATELIPELRDSAHSGCFHDGYQVLPAVIDMHKRIRQDCHRNDHIVSDIIVLVEDMLEEVGARPDAVGVYRRSRRALSKSINAGTSEQRKDTQDNMFPEPFPDLADPYVIRTLRPTSSSNYYETEEYAPPPSTEVRKGKVAIKATVDPSNPAVPNRTLNVTTKTEPEVPKVSVNDVFKWIASRNEAKGIFKDRRSAVTPLEGHQYLERLDGRDQVSNSNRTIFAKC